MNLFIATVIAQIGDARGVDRPARARGLCLAIGQCERIAISGRCGQPDLVRIASGIGCPRDALAIGRPVGPCAPGGFFRAHQVRLRITIKRAAPDPAGAVDRLGVGDVDQFFSVRRPARRDLVVEGTVVVAHDLAAPLRPDGPSFEVRAVQRADEHMEMPRACGRHPGNACAIGREARFGVDGAAARDLFHRAGAKVEYLQFHRIAKISREHDARAVA